MHAHPDTLDRLKADWTLAPAAIEELHRFTCPVQMTKPRFVRQDTEFCGRTFKRDDKLMALLAAGNLDPDVFDEPLTLNIDREKTPHLGFGGGPHLCLGLHLARAELRIGLETLYTRLPELMPMRDAQSLGWTKRIGTRGMTSLPVRF